MNPWIQTVGQRAVDLLNPDPASIAIDDIAVSLSRICRFNGHCQEFYSVAQHSVLVSERCERHPLAGLLRDAAEAYVGDLCSPVKLLVPEFHAVERRVAKAVAAAFGLDPADFLAPEVTRADLRMLATEKRDLMSASPRPWVCLPLPYPDVVEGWPSATACAAFLDRFEKLTRAAA